MTEVQAGMQEDAQTLLKQLRDFVEQCRQLLDDDKDADVTGLDVRTKTLCDTIAAMPVGEARKFNPKLDSLMEELGELSQALERRKASLLGEAGSLGQQHKAVSAYQRAEQTRPLGATPRKGDGTDE